MSLPGGGLPTGVGDGSGGMSAEELKGQQMYQSMNKAMESCYAKTVMSGAAGFVLGGAFGLFMASMAYDTPFHQPAPGATGAVAGAGAGAGAATTTSMTGTTSAASTIPKSTTTTTSTTTSIPKPLPTLPTTSTLASAATTTTSSATSTTATSATLPPQPPLPGTTPQYISSLPLRQQLRIGLRDMGARSWSSARNFGMIGALFSGIECGIEGFRAKNDTSNAVAAGCVTGAILARSGGPSGMAIGCGGFAAFSAAIEAYMRMPANDD